MPTMKEFLHNLVDHVGAGSLHQQIDEIEEPKPAAQRSDSPTSDPANDSEDIGPDGRTSVPGSRTPVRGTRGEEGNSAPDGGVTDTGDGTGKQANPAESGGEGTPNANG